MSMQDLEKAFELIEEHFSETEKFFGFPQTYEIIHKAEEALALKFPKTYKKFLEKYGYGGVGWFEIYGIIDSDFINSEVPDAIWLSLEGRKAFSFPHHLIAIYNVGEGTKYCLDTSQMNESGECPVVAWPLGGYEET
ncbi:MAG: SMI1/KNR4 family protein, partial [Alphaproteobacteria bacterium]